jgi:hypothetical protein
VGVLAVAVCVADALADGEGVAPGCC